MKLSLTILLAMLAVPAVSLAGDRWSSGDRGGRDRGYRYDRGERYYDRGYSKSRSSSSFGFAFGFGSSGYRGYNYGGVGYNYGYGRILDDCYRPAPPVVYRETYVYPRYEYTSRYYDCPPVREYCAPAPKVYYYDGGSRYSGGAYYYRR